MDSSESTPRFGLLDRPDYDDDFLFDTAGYVTRIWVEQEGSRDQVKFTLKIFDQPFGGEIFEHSIDFIIYLDRGTTAAFAQLQLLRDAFEATKNGDHVLVQVHFNFGDTRDWTWGYVYWVRIVAGYDYPTTVNDYYGTRMLVWYTHLD